MLCSSRPGLSPAERRYLYVLLPASLLSFLLGAAFGHQVLFPPAVRFLLSFGSEVAEPYIRIGNYTNLMLTLLFWMGLVFEMPILAYFLSKIGVVTSSFLARNRRYAVVMAFILGALITPTFDPFNQTLVALPIIVMYEIGIWLAKLGGREESKGRSSVWARVLRWSIVVLFILLFIAYGYIAYLMASGVTKAERNLPDRSPTEFGLAYEDVEFPSRGGDISLKGWLIGEAGEGPAVIVIHGLNTNRAHENGLRIARSLFDGGYTVLLFDLRAHGDSGGERVSGGFHEKDDMLGAYDFLVERGVSPGRVGVLGSSMGAAIALLGAPEEPGIRAVVADRLLRRCAGPDRERDGQGHHLPEMDGARLRPRIEVGGAGAVRHQHRTYRAGKSGRLPRLSRADHPRGGGRPHPRGARRKAARGGVCRQPDMDASRCRARRCLRRAPGRVRREGDGLLQEPVGHSLTGCGGQFPGLLGGLLF